MYYTTHNKIMPLISELNSISSQISRDFSADALKIATYQLFSRKLMRKFADEHGLCFDEHFALDDHAQMLLGADLEIMPATISQAKLAIEQASVTAEILRSLSEAV